MSTLDAVAADWPAISELLDEVLTLPPEEREPWLAGLAGDRAAHRATIRALLAVRASVNTEDFLAELPCLPPRGTTADSDALLPGGSVGPYRLIEEIGVGGMGRVWLAERADGTLQRRVALKLPHVVWGGALAARLARERDILASLEHPNIARLYDAGTDANGRPYLAMEYVEGEPIDVFCAARGLSLQSRLALILQAMAAMAHAHSRLVIHRDLKPSNILVTRDRQVRLLDFGIAKLLEEGRTRDTELTEVSGRALTRDYASPEQIRGQPLGTASDVYSMAVVAYRVLCGAPPYRLQGHGSAALEQAIESAVPLRASQAAVSTALWRELQGDIDAILNMALKKRADERYPTMEAFARDLQRHLDGQPVQARPDRLGYRAGKFIARHRVQAMAATVVALSLVGGAGVAFWQAYEARLQAERAQTEAATAQAVQRFLQAVFRSNTGNQDDPERERNTTARELLDRGVERIDIELREAPQARLRLLETLAEMYEGMALREKAAELQSKRLDLARATWGRQSRQAAEALAAQGGVLTYLDRRKEALEAVTEAGAVLDGLGDVGSRTRFEIDLALMLLYQRSDNDRALAAAERAVANARARSAAVDLVQALQVRASIAAHAGDGALAREGTLEAIRLVEADPTLGANNLSALYVTLADAQATLGELDAAASSFGKAIAIARERNAQAPIFLHTAERRYGSFLRRHGRLSASVEVLRPGYEWASTKPSGFGVMLPTLVVEYARALIAVGRVEEGLATIDEANAMLAGAEEAPEMVGSIALFQAQGLIEQGRIPEATRALAAARQFFGAGALGPTPQLAAATRQVQVAEGRADAALRDFQAARLEQKKPAVPAPTESPQFLAESARLHLDAGRIEAAADQAAQSLARIEGDSRRAWLGHTEAQSALVLGLSLLRQGQAREAHPVLARALGLHKAIYDPQHSLAVADVLIALSDAERVLGNPAAASNARAEAARIHANHVRVGPQHRAAMLIPTR